MKDLEDLNKTELEKVKITVENNDTDNHEEILHDPIKSPKEEPIHYSLKTEYWQSGLFPFNVK